MREFTLPANGWKPREYQKPFWRYMLKDGLQGKHAELIWHRRAGKDDCLLHLGAIATTQRVGTYWHMLPKKDQVRKAIWEAVNPHTGKRRIHEAFPPELFDHRDTDMLVRAKFNESTWQCLGSDNYENAIGSPPCGITYSEWALANPSVRGYLRPIIAENGGYQAFITTPRGKNHAYSTYKQALRNPDQFAQLLTIHDTGILSPDQLKAELEEYIATYGHSYGMALFAQEYECSFDAAIIGAFWGDEFMAIDREGRICEVPHDPNFPVHVATDLGRTDDLSIWWYQVIANEIRVLEHYGASGDDPDEFASQLMGKVVRINIIDRKIQVDIGADMPELKYRQAYRYGRISLPHDGAAKTFVAKGKTVQEQLGAVFGRSHVRVTPNLSKQDQIQAGRQALKKTYFDYKAENNNGIEALRAYHREWDDDKKIFKSTAEHDWSSHPSDAYMQLALNYEQAREEVVEDQPIKHLSNATLNELWPVATKQSARI